MVQKVLQFINKDIWRIDLTTLPRYKAVLLQQLRVLIIAIKGFIDDKCQLRASALTFYTVLSIVPVVAMLFGIAKGFEFDRVLEKQLKEDFAVYEEILTPTFEFAHSLLAETKGGLIAGIGILILLWSVMRVLGHIEHSFNEIWQVQKARTIVRRFTEYFAIMFVAPLVIILSGSATVFIATQFDTLAHQQEYIRLLGPLVHALLRLAPIFLIWFLFSFLYIVMPNTKVNLKSAIIAGIIAGTVFKISEWGYISSQVGVARNNAIYGSLAALPLFLIWLQIAWTIVLLGAEIAFAYQNLGRYQPEMLPMEVTADRRRLVTLVIANEVIKGFSKGDAPLTSHELSAKLGFPIRLVKQILGELVDCKVLSEIRTANPMEFAYQPARSLDHLSIHKVLRALETHGEDEVDVPNTEAVKKLEAALEQFHLKREQSLENQLIRDI